MGIVITSISIVCLCGLWYFIGRNSIYNKLKADYREALKLIGLQQAIIEAYKLKYESKETEQENGGKD